MEIKNNLKTLYLSLIIFSLPFIQFILNNIQEIDVVIGKSFYYLIFFLVIFVIFFSVILNRFNLKKNLLDKILVSTLIFWLLFNHNFLKLYINNLFNNHDFVVKISSELSLAILILLIIFFSIYIFKKNIFLLRFFFLFFSLSFLFTIFQIINYEKLVKEKDIYTPEIIFEDKLKLKKNNIYYLILDGMQPIEDFEKFYKKNLQDYLQNVKKKGFLYIEGTESLYSNTSYSLSSMFYLNNVSEKSSKIPFPVVMRSKFKPDLIHNLNNLGYDFKWIGNFFAYCPKYNLKYCLDKKKNPIIDTYLYINFFRQTPLIQTIINFGHIFNFDYNKNFFFKLNNGIGRLINHLEKSDNSNEKATFYFIHHMSPHWPYVTNKDCSYKFYEGEKNLKGYESSYLCVLKRIENLINYLAEFDPNAIVIFQSDHNWKLSKNHEQDKKKIFNLIKINDCKLTNDVNFHNVNTLRLILSCITGNEPRYLIN